jgi:DNA-binding NarL/FixJ family response regulator
MLFLLWAGHADVAVPDAKQETISYLHDPGLQWHLDNIQNADFIPYTVPINQGINNGVFWIKIERPTPGLVRFENTQITSAKLYRNGHEISPIPSHNYLTLPLESGVSYIELTAHKQAYIPIKTVHKDEFLKDQQQQHILIGMFYGFGLMVLVMNLSFYVTFKDKTFLYYCLFLTSVMITFAHRDGYFSMLGFSHNQMEYTEVLAHFLTGITAVMFASQYLRMRTHFPRFRYTLYLSVYVALLLDVLYLTTGQYVYNGLADTVIMYMFIGCWAVAFKLAKKHRYALLFCVAYSLIIILVLDFYVAAAFGLIRLGVDVHWLKLGGYFEMLIITVAVVFRMQSVQQENQQMRQKIEAYMHKINQLSNNQYKQNKVQTNSVADLDLSLREREVLDLIAAGKSNQAIANDLHVSVNTIKYHVKNIYQKLDINSRKDVLKVIQ